MNTPRSKPVTRANSPKEWGNLKRPDGNYTGALTSPRFLTYFSQFISGWSHLEEHMVDMLASLIGESIIQARADANVIFRSIVNSRDRITVMRNLLQESRKNITKSDFYDFAIKEFDSLNSTRNAYIHGLWWTHDETERVFLVSPEPSYFPSFFAAREVTENEFKCNINRLRKLDWKLLLELPHEHIASLPQTQASQAGDIPIDDLAQEGDSPKH